MGPPQQAAWERLRRALAAPTTLAPFDAKSDSGVVLTVNASADGFGAALSQERGGKREPIMFCSRVTSPAERNYSNSERELRAVVYGLEELIYLTAGRKVTVETDHRALVTILDRNRDTPQTTPRLIRLRTRS